jgi:hypothetical protein
VNGDTDALAEQTARLVPGTTAPSGRHRLLAIGIWGGCALVALVLWASYVRFSQTISTNSDGASNALQAWQMLHGNPLLRGWVLSDVSFYTTELPQYLLVELIAGLNANVIHIAAGLTYTLALIGAAALAAGRARGWAAVIGACIAAGIMLDPQGADGVVILLSSPDHIGTSVPIMAAWLILDRARPSWAGAIAVALVLGWAEVADSLVTYAAIVPLVLVVAIRLADALVRDRSAPRRRVLAARRYEIALAAGAIVAAAAAHLALRLIAALGGFNSPGPTSSVAPLGHILRHNLPVIGHGLLLLFGADFLDYRAGPVVVLHLVSVLLVVVGIGLVARRFLADGDLIAQLLLAGIVVNLAVFIVSTNVAGLPTMREVDVLLPFGAALAGRQLGPRIAGALAAGSRSTRTRLAAGSRSTRTRLAAGSPSTRSRLGGLSRPAATGLLVALAIVGAGYAAGLADAAGTPIPVSSEQQLAGWLESRHLDNGLADFWRSNAVTLFSEDKVRVRLVDIGYRLHPQTLVRGTRESYAGWYAPAVNTANFVILAPYTAQYPGFTDLAAVTATFGQPTRTYHYDGYTILVWPHDNLLTALTPAGS